MTCVYADRRLKAKASDTAADNGLTLREAVRLLFYRLVAENKLSAGPTADPNPSRMVAPLSSTQRQKTLRLRFRQRTASVIEAEPVWKRARDADPRAWSDRSGRAPE